MFSVSHFPEQSAGWNRRGRDIERGRESEIGREGERERVREGEIELLLTQLFLLQ